MNSVMNQSIHKLTCVIGDMISNAFKSNRQVNYKPQTNDFRRRTESRTEYPTQHSVGFAIHQSTRSKKVIDIMHALGLSVDYNHILRLETLLPGSVLERIAEDGQYIPPFLQRNKFPFFAIDNSDFNEDTPDGKQTTHATATAVYQRVDNDFESAPIVPIKTSNRSLQEIPETNIVQV